MPRPAADIIAATIEQTKQEIRDDIELGVVPADIAAFSDLHDHVDANTYGGVCDENGPWADAYDEDGIAAINEVQDAVDAWIKAGGLTAALADA